MAGQPDGSIVIDTHLDQKGFEIGSKELQSAIKSLHNKANALGPALRKAMGGGTNAISAFQGKAATVENTISELERKLEKLGNSTVPTEEYAWLQKELEKARLEAEKLADRQEKMKATGVRDQSQAWKNLQYDIDLSTQKIRDYTAEMEQLESSGKAFQLGSDTNQYNELLGQLAEAREALEQTKKNADSAGKSLKTMGNLKLTVLILALKKVSAGMGNLIKKTASFIWDIQKSVLLKPASMFGSLLKNISRLTLGIFTVRSLFSKLRSSIKDGIDNLAQYSAKTNKALSALKSSLTQLKNSLATAFSPILTVIEPALTRLISGLSRAIETVGMFFAAMTGAKVFVRAKAVQEDYADSLKDTEKNASKVNKALAEQRKQLMGFDELNRLQNDKGYDEDSIVEGLSPSQMFEEVEIPALISDFVNRLREAFASGDFAAIGAMIAEGLNRAMRIVDNWIINTLTPMGIAWAERIAIILNGLIAGYDWSLLGKTVADFIAAGVSTWWTFAMKFDFDTVGNKIAEGINSALATMSMPDEAGLNIWQKLGQALSKTVNGLLSIINNVLQNADWAKVGKSIGDFISSIDWGATAWNFAKLAGCIIKGISEAIAGWTNTRPVSAALATMLATAFAGVKLGPLVTAAMFAKSMKTGALGSAGAGAGAIGKFAGAATAAIGQAAKALAGIGTIVSGVVIAVSNFFSMMTSGFSWAKEILMVIGTALTAVGAIILGAPALVAGVIAAIVAAVATAVVVIKDNWAAICSWFEELPDKIMQGWDNFTNGLVKGWADFSSGFMSDMDRFGSWLGSVWQGLIDGIVADWQGLVDGAMAIWTETKLKFADVVESFKEMGRNITEGFQNGIAEFTDDPMGWLKDHVFDPFINAFKTLFGIHSPSAVFTELGGYITAGLLNGVLNGMKNIGSWIMSNVFSPFINGFKAAFGIASPSRKMLEQGLYLIDGLKNGLSERVPIVYDFFKSSCTKVKEIFGGFSWRSIGSNICDGIGSGINEGWSWLRNKATSVAKSLLDAAKSALGIHSPSRVFRDEVGKNIGYGIGEGIEASEGSIMGSVRSVAGAIADEFQSNEYSITPIGADFDGNFVRTLDNVSDTIANSFSSLMDQLQAIADRVTFTVPVTASSVVPYANKTDTRPPEGDRAYNGGDDMADIIIDAILQGCEAIVKAINEKPTGATIGDDAIFAAYNRHSDKISIVKG